MSSHFQEHLRLTLLRLLIGAPGYRANSSILAQEVENFGFAATRDQVKTELAWLAEQGLVRADTVGPLMVVSLTERGLDVGEGRAFAPGVQRPSPKA